MQVRPWRSMALHVVPSCRIAGGCTTGSLAGFTGPVRHGGRAVYVTGGRLEGFQAAGFLFLGAARFLFVEVVRDGWLLRRAGLLFARGLPYRVPCRAAGIPLARVHQHGRGEPADFLAGGGRVELVMLHLQPSWHLAMVPEGETLPVNSCLL